MPVKINPSPGSIIRIMMVYKSIDEKIEVTHLTPLKLGGRIVKRKYNK